MGRTCVVQIPSPQIHLRTFSRNLGAGWPQPFETHRLAPHSPEGLGRNLSRLAWGGPDPASCRPVRMPGQG